MSTDPNQPNEPGPVSALFAGPLKNGVEYTEGLRDLYDAAGYYARQFIFAVTETPRLLHGTHETVMAPACILHEKATIEGVLKDLPPDVVSLIDQTIFWSMVLNYLLCEMANVLHEGQVGGPMGAFRAVQELKEGRTPPRAHQLAVRLAQQARAFRREELGMPPEQGTGPASTSEDPSTGNAQ